MRTLSALSLYYWSMFDDWCLGGTAATSPITGSTPSRCGRSSALTSQYRPRTRRRRASSTRRRASRCVSRVSFASVTTRSRSRRPAASRSVTSPAVNTQQVSDVSSQQVSDVASSQQVSDVASSQQVSDIASSQQVSDVTSSRRKTVASLAPINGVGQKLHVHVHA